MSSSRERVLIDTSYILPTLGVGVRGLEHAIRRLRGLHVEGKLELYYSPFSILEALGKISKAFFDERRLEMGLTSLTDSGTFKEALPTTHGYMKALELRKGGFRDLIDLLLYTTAMTRKIRLLTRDLELIKYVERVGEDSKVFIDEEHLK